MHIGIDFGTCYSSAALFINGETKLVKEPIKSGYSFPSSVFLNKQGELLVGQAAENNKRLNPERYITEFKRDLGKSHPYIIGDRRFLPEDLIAEMLRSLKREAEEMCDLKLSKVVATIPASYESHRKELMEKAARDAGFEEVHLLVEPIAAAMHYEKSVGQDRAIADREIILAYDLGGGTFDAALLQKRNDSYELLAMPVGNQQLGGIDFDRAIYQYLLSTCSDALREQLEQSDTRGLRTRYKVADWVREFKHQLSSTQEHADELPIGDMEVFELTRAKFEELIEPKLRMTIDLCTGLLNEANVKSEEIGRTLMIGGSCRIPYVRRILEEKLGCSVVRIDEPDLAVCIGAAQYPYYLMKEAIDPIRVKVAEQDGVEKVGYFGPNGWIVPPQYDWGDEFASDEGLILVEKNEKYGFINREGEEVIDFQFDSVRDSCFSEGLAPVGIYDSGMVKTWRGFVASSGQTMYGFIDSSGMFIIERKFEDAYPFSNGLARIKVNMYEMIEMPFYGFINKQGEVVIKPRFRSASDFRNGLSSVRFDFDANENYLINLSGELVNDFSFEDIKVRELCCGLARVKKDNKWGYVDSKGVLVVPTKYDSAFSFMSCCLALVESYDRKKVEFHYHYIDESGAVAIDGGSLGFDAYDGFSEGLARIQKNDKYGFIDIEGSNVIEPRFCYASRFNNGLCHVIVDDDLDTGRVDAIIDSQGNYVIEPRKCYLSKEFSDGMIRFRQGGKYGYFSSAGDIAIPNILDDAGEFSLGRAAAKIGGKWGYVNKVGQMVIEPQFDWASAFCYEPYPIASVSIQDRRRIINLEGEFLY